ncbi:MAG: FxsA family protein [Spirochaetales bacterium]|nr:FxsA family protein [Spirochaetales bacterium]
MLETNFFLKLFRKGFIIKLLLLTLLYMLLPLTEIFIIMYMSDFFGQFFLLGLAASTGLLGVLIALLQVNKTVASLKEKISKGEYPGKEFIILCGILVSSLLLITPGFITDLLGFFMLVPFFRDEIGKAITKRIDKTLREIYEYLRLYEL